MKLDKIENLLHFQLGDCKDVTRRKVTCDLWTQVSTMIVDEVT